MWVWLWVSSFLDVGIQMASNVKTTSKLTALGVGRAIPASSQFKLFDGGGLHLVVTPSGGKLWRLAYRFQGKEKTLSIGAYPVITLAEARERAHDAKRLLSNGVDPSALKKAEKVADAPAPVLPTFKDVALEVIAQKRLRCTENYVDGYLRSLEIHLFPSLGDRPVKEIGALEIMKVCKQAEAAGQYMAHKLAQRAGEVFDHAVLTERRESNPINKATHKALSRHQQKSFAAITAAELPDFMTALREYRGFPLTKLMIEFLLHVFVRTMEARRLEWPMIDMQKRIITIPGGRELNRKNVPLIPISDQVAAILEKAKGITGGHGYVFPMFRDHSRMASENVITAALSGMGYHEQMTGHGFRSLARTTIQEAGGFHGDVIELQLGHSVARNDVEAAYKRVEYWSERVRMMQWWSNYLHDQRG